MYGLSGPLMQPAAKKRGRPSAQSKFLEKQRDLFPIDLHTSTLTSSNKAAREIGAERAAAQGAAGDRAAARSAAFSPATNRGGKFDGTSDNKIDNVLNPMMKGSFP